MQKANKGYDFHNVCVSRIFLKFVFDEEICAFYNFFKEINEQKQAIHFCLDIRREWSESRVYSSVPNITRKYLPLIFGLLLINATQVVK